MNSVMGCVTDRMGAQRSVLDHGFPLWADPHNVDPLLQAAS